MPFAAPQKKITGGVSQLFKDGHMLSARAMKLNSDDGTLVHLSTVKTAFCDARKIEVEFRWNKYGKKFDDAYEARFNWGLASAMCLANPEKGVGEIRDICDVKVSDQHLVTCPQLNLRSVDPDEFEAALMANQDILDQLYTYQKIDRLKGLDEFAEYSADVRARQAGKAPKDETKEEKPKTPSKAKSASKSKQKPEATPLFEASDIGKEDEG
jgi:hypothetical protein